MSGKNLVLMLVAHEGYYRQPDSSVDIDFNAQNDRLFSAITDTYVPLLNMFESLEKDNIHFKLSIVISPNLCALLDDPFVQELYINWLDNKISLGEKEVIRCASDKALCKLAEEYLENAKKIKEDYLEKYQGNLLAKFSYYESHGYIELLSTAATYAYLPLYVDYPESINAQIEAGLISHKHYFGSLPDGFWLPYMGYAKNLESVLRAYNVIYTVVDPRAVLFSQERPESGIFEPVRCYNSLGILARDDEEYLNGDNGFKENDLYRSEEKDIGFDLNIDELSPFIKDGAVRVPTGYKYYNKANAIYNAEEANKKVLEDAEYFVNEKISKLNKATKLLPSETVSDICTFDIHEFGRNWHEGIVWLENVIRMLAASSEINLEHGKSLFIRRYSLKRVNLYPCSASGYGEALLDNKNDWMLRYVYKASERMSDLAERFPTDTGLKARLLNLASREVLLAQSSDWPMMIQKGLMPDYAENSFKDNILSFTKVYDSLGSNSVSTEWLTSVESRHPLFSWINYHIFSKKK